MTIEEVKHLARLSRIKLSEEEAQQFTGEIDAVLDYVSQLNEIVAATGVTKEVGAVYNVMRQDEVTNDPNQFTDALLEAIPEKKGRFMRVKKILDND